MVDTELGSKVGTVIDPEQHEFIKNKYQHAKLNADISSNFLEAVHGQDVAFDIVRMLVLIF